ncbi:MAG: Trk family potassium uptake protein [Lachnospiraceae bacterium]|nr:Trk family potassium uptake protein [Lachnospiraceae bacterium]
MTKKDTDKDNNKKNRSETDKLEKKRARQKKQKDLIKSRHISQTHFIAAGFLLMILLGGFLLMLPISSRDRTWTDPLSALFTATSTSCVTGLAVVDTYSHWSLFGQVVLLTLIQIGGLGFITIGVGFSMVFRRRIGLRQRDLLKESVNAFEIGGIIRLWKNIFYGTLIFEGAGAFALAFRFIPEYGFARGLWYSIFHSISAFCNAGFDLFGQKEKYSSFVYYVSDPLVNIVLCLLIIIGSLGFVVWKDLVANGFHFKKYALHTKLVIVINTVLIIGGAVFLFISEYGNTIADFDMKTKILASLFGSVTTRTAGFNTVDTAALTPASKLVTMILMFVGGSPGSTAGGIKTTTFAVILISVLSNLRNQSGANVFKRRVSEDVVSKAYQVFMLNLILALTSMTLILLTSNLKFDDVLFEVISAVSTVGMTTGITRDLNTFGRIMIMLLMYAGRIGSMTFALSLISPNKKQPVTLPVEKITIG